MTITVRPIFRKKARYKFNGKPVEREIAKNYEISGSNMKTIANTIDSIKQFLNSTVTVKSDLPVNPNDTAVTEWQEDDWSVSW